MSVASTSYGLDRLSDLIAAVVTSNPAILAAQQNYLIKQINIDLASSWPNPELTYEHDRLYSNPMNIISIGQEIPWPGKKDFIRKIAEIDVQKAKSDYQAVIIKVVYALKLNYFNYVRQDQIIMFNQAHLDSLRSLLGNVISRYSLGLGTQVDVLSVQASVAKQETLVNNLKLERRYLLSKINALLYRSYDSNIIPEPFMPTDNTGMDYADLENALVMGNPELMLSKLNIESARIEKSSAQINYWPDIDLTYKEEISDFNWSAMLGFQWPLWSRPDLGVAIAGKNSEMMETVYLDTRNNMFAELRKIYTEIQTRLAMYQLNRLTLLPLAQQADNLITQGYGLSRNSLAEVLSSQRNILQIEIDSIDALAGYHIALAEMDWMLGRN